MFSLSCVASRIPELSSVSPQRGLSFDNFRDLGQVSAATRDEVQQSAAVHDEGAHRQDGPAHPDADLTHGVSVLLMYFGMS